MDPAGQKKRSGSISDGFGMPRFMSALAPVPPPQRGLTWWPQPRTPVEMLARKCMSWERYNGKGMEKETWKRCTEQGGMRQGPGVTVKQDYGQWRCSWTLWGCQKATRDEGRQHVRIFSSPQALPLPAQSILGSKGWLGREWVGEEEVKGSCLPLPLQPAWIRAHQHMAHGNAMMGLTGSLGKGTTRANLNFPIRISAPSHPGAGSRGVMAAPSCCWKG